MSAIPTTRFSIRLVLAVLLLTLGALLAATWFTWISPQLTSLRYDEINFQGENSPAWWDAHRRASRRLWKHDDFVRVGQYATKDDVAWIIDSGPPGKTFNDCSGGHRAAALEYITNQSAGDTREGWQQWWKENRDKPQNLWIVDGFAERGITTAFPMQRAVQLELLIMIGSIEVHPDRRLAKDEADAPLRFNALRLLRDVRFDPESITVQELTSDTTGHLMKGVVALAGFRESHPLRSGVGVVFAEDDGQDQPRLHPAVHWIPWIWLACTLLCLLFGLRLCRAPPSDQAHA